MRVCVCVCVCLISLPLLIKPPVAVLGPHPDDFISSQSLPKDPTSQHHSQIASTLVIPHPGD
jgi:hypothetical protein